MNIYTGNDLKVGHSAHAETGETITVEDKNHPGAPDWIDNPGYDWCSLMVLWMLDAWCALVDFCFFLLLS